ncbi:hypothetical protein Pelo_5198 [Pelomyxa schiedti]|nr:hypothetical protein Pelo_5198 [Pelomyxa schiedti]
MDDRERMRLLKLLMGTKLSGSGSSKSSSPAVTPQEMQQKYELYVATHDFHVGDLVQWKPAMKNRKKPADGEIGVVVNLLDEPVYPSLKRECDAGSPLFREPLDIAIGMLDSDGEFIVCHFDKHRFMPAVNSSMTTPEGSRLQQLCRSLTEPPDPTLRPGDFVKWKPGLKNKKKPGDGESAIVIEILEEPIFDMKKSAGTPYFLEPLSVKLGLLDSDGDFLIFHYDLRRFEKSNR